MGYFEYPCSEKLAITNFGGLQINSQHHFLREVFGR